MTYDIFISYKRRGSSSATAAYIYDLLTKKGYNVFFDRKEIRQGQFDEQLFHNISDATDIIVLLEDGSLTACFNGVEDSYKTDWFCMEIMHALKEKKRIIPLLLEGYRMPDCSSLPDELKGLAMQNAISLDISEIEIFYKKYLVEQGYLASKPKNLYISQMEGKGISDFLFHSQEDCDLFEFGNLVGRLNVNNDEDHPYKYTVPRSGEHHFVCRNNNTCEEQRLSVDIAPDAQKYIQLKWTLTQNVWQLTETVILAETDAEKLLFWGKGLFEGTGTHDPDVGKSFLCLSHADELGCSQASDFIKAKVGQIAGSDIEMRLRYDWCLKAAHLGSDMAQHKVSRMLLKEDFFAADKCAAFNWALKAAEQGYLPAMNDIVVMYERGQGVRQDFSEAVRWAELAASTENPKGIVGLGLLYYRGVSVKRNYEKAYDLFLKAAEEKEYHAYNYLGLMFYCGLGRDKDLDEAIKWSMLAAESNNPSCMNNLAYMLLEKGEYENALYWAKKAIEIEPNKCTITDTLAGILFQLGRYEESLVQYNRTAELMKRESAILDFHTADEFEHFKKETCSRIKEITEKVKGI